MADALRQIAGERRHRMGGMHRGTMPADREDAGGVFARIVSARQHRLVAGAFAFIALLAADEPHQWMKPEQDLHHLMQQRLEIVAPRDVFVLMRQYGVELRGRQPPEQRGRQQHHRMKNARHGWFDVFIRDERFQ